MSISKCSTFIFLALLLLMQAIPAAAESYTDPLTGIEFIKIPGGCYQMGSDTGNRDEKPVHEVCVDDFWISRTEVTNKQYRKFEPDHDSRNYMGDDMNGDDQPVVYVSWNDAFSFALWMTRNSNGTFHLPSEEQWEYAARAGSKGDYYWNGTAEQACTYANVYDLSSAEKNTFNWAPFDCSDGYPVTSPVGSFKPNGFGLYDMLGNVWEWCSDRYDPESYAQGVDEDQGIPAIQRVLRGGSWYNAQGSLRQSNRARNSPDYRIGSVGFRLILQKQ